MRSFLSSVRVVAAKEFRDCWRNLWLIVGSALFACLSLAVVFGTAAIGGDFSFRPLEAVMTSVVTLGVFLIPLIAVLISYDAFVGEQEHGTLILLLTYPLSRPTLLTGKLLGQSAALGVCLLLGFSVLPLLTVLNVLPYDLTRLSLLTAVLIFSGWLLGLVFILISLTISLLAKNKARALGVLLSIWLLSVLFYDLGLLIITIAFEHQITNGFLNICLAVNPASAFRLFNQQLLENSTIPLQTAWLGVYLCLWSAVLFVLDRFILNKRTF